MLTAAIIIAGGVALWVAIATGIAIGIGRAIAITTADQRQQVEQAPALRLVS